jgi:hypothetical protein
MNHTAQRRLARLAGLVLVTLLVCAIAAQMAAAYRLDGSGFGDGVVALSGPEPAAASEGATTPPATLQGRGGIASAAVDARSQPTPADTNASAAILFSLAAVLVGVVVWIAIDRRRRLTGPSLAAFCARNPADPRCAAA